MAWSAGRRWASVCAVAIVGFGLAGGKAWGQDDPRVDGEGRDVRVWPPDVEFDHLWMKLEVTIPDMAVAGFVGRQEITVTPRGRARGTLKLRAGDGLTFSRATVDGVDASFVRGDGVIEVALGREVGVGEKVVVGLEYDADKPGGGGAGLTFSADDRRTEAFDPMCHSQGQPESNHLWFACHDFPNERVSTEVIARVPEGFTAISNGRLAGQETIGGTTTFHWVQAKEHPYYLVALIVGKFDEVNVGGPGSARPGLPLMVYGPVGSAERLREGFHDTAQMVATFERLLDEAYPWDKYAQVLCRDFSAGAMENTSCTTWQQSIGLAGHRAVEETNAHELMHQWFGDLVGYRGWEHTWLGEGWATYGESLWAEAAHGREAYEADVFDNMRTERAASGKNRRFTQTGMVSKRYSSPDECFFRSDNVYSKGGCVLHMARERIGDEAFFRGTALYLDRFRNRQAETSDFRRCLEEASGESLERFFDQWVMRPGHPSLGVDLGWDEGANVLRVTMEQTQAIDADNPAYALVVPVFVRYDKEDASAGRYVDVVTDERVVTREFRLDRAPVDVVVDPHMTNLCSAKVRKPLAMWMRQLEDGPTTMARLAAAEELSEGFGVMGAARVAWASMRDCARGARGERDGRGAERVAEVTGRIAAEGLGRAGHRAMSGVTRWAQAWGFSREEERVAQAR